MCASVRHQCMIYDGSPAPQLRSLAASAKERLEAGSRVLFLNSPSMVAGFRSYLAAAGVDVAQEIMKGSLIASSEQNHLVNGLFDVGRMLTLLKESLDRALDDGYSALWATGDMMWELGGEKNLEKLLEYECGLEELLKKYPALGGVCQYHKAALPANSVHVALYAHQAVYINETLSRMNPYFTKPGTLGPPLDNSACAHLEEMLSQIH